MAKEDYYQLLGVSRNASDDDIKKSFRRLAMKYHPDRNRDNPEAEEQFKKIKEAHDVLSDPKKRSAYDQFGHAGVDGSAGGGFNGGPADLGDIFGGVFRDIFGGMRGGGEPSYGAQQARLDQELILALRMSSAAGGEPVKLPLDPAAQTL